MAALDGDSLAYLTIREGEDNKGRYWEIGVIGHGSHAAAVAGEAVEDERSVGPAVGGPGLGPW